MLVRLLQWAIRLPIIPQGHEPTCQAGITAPLGCKCNVRKLRPPRFAEAVMGVY
jgi:hypothetical protein